MSFGDDDHPMPVPPPLPPPPPSAPQFAMGMGRRIPRGPAKGGTILTSPLAPAPAAATARRTLITGDA